MFHDQTGWTVGNVLYGAIPFEAEVEESENHERPMRPLSFPSHPEEPGLVIDFYLMYQVCDRNYHHRFKEIVRGDYDHSYDSFAEGWHDRDEEGDSRIYREEEL